MYNVQGQSFINSLPTHPCKKTAPFSRIFTEGVNSSLLMINDRVTTGKLENCVQSMHLSLSVIIGSIKVFRVIVCMKVDVHLLVYYQRT